MTKSTIYIEIEDLAANALIILFEKYGINHVSFETIDNYGEKVIDILTQRGRKAVLVCHKYMADILTKNYSGLFEVYIKDQKQHIKIKDMVDIKDVIKLYRASLSNDVLYAYTCEESINLLKKGI